MQATTDDTSSTVEDIVEQESISFTATDALEMAGSPWLFRYFLRELGDDIYQHLILALTHENLGNKEAKTLWQNALEHQAAIALSLGRRPNFIVALADYLIDFSEQDIRPILIDTMRSKDILQNSTRDTLTGLFRREVFDQMLEREYDEVIREGKSFCIAMIDIDDFKAVNDNYGHQRGDEVLQVIGKQVKKSVRTMDIAARYGGEELVVLMPHVDIKQAGQVANRIREVIAGLSFQDFKVTVSIGISDAHYDSAADALAAADGALYQAKHQGKNQVVLA